MNQSVIKYIIQQLNIISWLEYLDTTKIICQKLYEKCLFKLSDIFLYLSVYKEF